MTGIAKERRLAQILQVADQNVTRPGVLQRLDIDGLLFGQAAHGAACVGRAALAEAVGNGIHGIDANGVLHHIVEPAPDQVQGMGVESAAVVFDGVLHLRLHRVVAHIGRPPGITIRAGIGCVGLSS